VQPVDFVRKSVNGKTDFMMVADLIPGSTIMGPMFLTEKVYQDLLNFIDIPASYRPLIVLGPPKSSKTVVLHQVLPSLVAARAVEFTPVFVRLTFSIDDSPLQAAFSLWGELKRVADAFDSFGVAAPATGVTFEHSCFEIANLIATISRQLESRKFRLWLLIDECQVCVCVCVHILCFPGLYHVQSCAAALITI
jgi:hypothetical protein